VLAQCVGNLVSHHKGDFIVGELQTLDDPGVEGDLSPRHGKGVERLRTDQRDLPAPLGGALVVASGVGQQALGNALKAQQFGVSLRGKGALGGCALTHLLVLQCCPLLDLFGRHEIGHARARRQLDTVACRCIAACRPGAAEPGDHERHDEQTLREVERGGHSGFTIGSP